jgi:hypothetical protein
MGIYNEIQEQTSFFISFKTFLTQTEDFSTKNHYNSQFLSNLKRLCCFL